MPTATVEREIKAALRPQTKRALIRKVAPFILWQLIAILFVEFALFFAGLGEEEIFKLDPVLGFRHMTNKRVTWRSEGFACSYLNSDGLRSEEVTLSKPPGVYRIALLGDSLTESLQVNLEQSFGRVLQDRLKNRGFQVQVLNFGTSGYSTAQEYLQLKGQVLKYQPDLVLVCYNSRDIFENWSPADQVITNVRPCAVHFPGGHLVVDSGQVVLWLKSPRAKILRQCEWLRENSRLWGLFSALELDWSLHNESYRFLLSFLTKPGKVLREVGKQASTLVAQEYKSIVNRISPRSVVTLPSTSTLTPASTSTSASASASASASTPAAKPVDTDKIYRELVMRTLGSLFVAMESECSSASAKMAVVALPVRSALCPIPGMETAYNNYRYEQEVVMLKTICAEKNISLINCEEKAERLSPSEREKLFISVHYSQLGQSFVAKELEQSLKDRLPKSGINQ